MSDHLTDKDLEKALDNLAIKIFKYIDKNSENLKEEIHLLRNDFGHLQSAVDGYAKRVEIYHHESKARDHEVARLTRWVEQIAEKTGVQLES